MNELLRLIIIINYYSLITAQCIKMADKAKQLKIFNIHCQCLQHRHYVRQYNRM